MIGVEQARVKALAYYQRHFSAWLACEFATLICNSSESDEDFANNASLALPLHPPTEQQALKDLQAARLWVQTWREFERAGVGSIRWATRNWVSVGHQEVPERLILCEPEIIAEFAQRQSEWHCALSRTNRLAELCNAQWLPLCPACDKAMLASALQKQIGKLLKLDDRNWAILTAVIDWLVRNPDNKCYVRQLPIRGIDSKWFEAHQKLIEPWYLALTGKIAPGFAQPPHLIRVRFLDASLAAGGFSDISVLASELDDYPKLPAAVLVCENLVSFLALPPMPGVIAIFGSGYAVSALGDISWLNNVPLWYWGDLDSNGFAILNRLRHYFPGVRSLLMASKTLEQHRDLCVSEPSPNRGELTRLTKAEAQTLAELLSGKEALRLEQERIQWQYVLAVLREVSVHAPHASS
jgi:hypothetical protein